MFQPITINKFQGLNSAVAPELIEVGEARDIYNFRHEKLGKLVSRNGYVYGLFTKPDNVSFLEPASEDYPNYVNDPVNAGTASRYHDAEVPYIFNKGFIGIGEYILDGQIEYLDTDRFMVYVCRSKIESATYTNDDQYSQCYLIAPLTGKYKDFLFNAGVTETDKLGWIGTNPTYIYERDQTAQGVIDEGRDELVAPAIPFLDYEYQNNLMRGAFKSTEWIDSFVKINQYRHQLVVSDRTNGDTLIEDEYSLRTGQECDPVEHSLRIRPNSLDSFDIDVVNFDLRLDAAEENDLAGDGVETAMALYQFEVEKETFKITQDYRDDEATKIEYFEAVPYKDETFEVKETTDPTEIQRAAAKRVNSYRQQIDNIWNNQVREVSRVPLHIKQYIPSYTANDQSGATTTRRFLNAGCDYNDEMFPFLDYKYDETTNYVYTNKREPEEFINLANNIQLKKTETVDEDGEALDSYSAGVYLWQDFKVPYKPIKSKSQLYYLQTAEDKEYDRIVAGQPRIVEFETQEGFAKQVPLTGWQYKFVWDYGNGILSAPSTEIKAPDILWRINLDDTNITNNTRYELLNTEWNKTLGEFQELSQLGELSSMPPVFEADGTLTGFGYYLWKIKNELYDISHEFGSQTDTDNIADIEAMTDEQKENIGTMLTVVGGPNIVMDGTFCEGITLLVPTITRVSGSGVPTFRIAKDWSRTPFTIPSDRTRLNLNIGTYLTAAPYIIVANLPLIVPLRPSSNSATYNSLFDVKGKLRTGYINTTARSITYDNAAGFSATPITPTTSTYDYDARVIGIQYVLPGYNSGINYIRSTQSKVPIDLFGTNRYQITNFLDAEYVNKPDHYSPYKTLLDDRLWAGTSPSTPIYEATVFPGDSINIRTLTSYPIATLSSTYLLRPTNSYILNECILSEYSPRAQNGIYWNFIADDLDENNNGAITTDRISTLLRHVNNEDSRLLSVKSTVPSQVTSRILLSGFADINIQDNGDEYFWTSQYFIKPWLDKDSADIGGVFDPLDILADRDYLREPLRLQNAPTPVRTSPEIEGLDDGLIISTDDAEKDFYAINGEYASLAHQEYVTDNIQAHVYLEGERLLAYEQLTSIVPSSLLFNAPRLGVTIAENKIPRRAKKLRIYRTITTADNAFDPNSYGLVEEVTISTATEVITAENGSVAIGEKYTATEDGKKYKGIYYFDEVKDANLDFNFDINESEGLRKPIQSRFNMPLNERMYYANFIQKYRPESPRLHQSKDAIGEEVDVVSIEKAYNTHYHVFGYNTALPTGEETAKYYDRDDKEYVRYAYAYEDVNGIISEIKYTGVIDPTLDARESTVAAYDYGQVVLFYLPNSYNGSIKHLNVYRTTYVLPDTRDTIANDYAAAVAVMTADNYTDTHKYYKIAEIDEKSMGILHDTKLPDKEEMGCDHEVVEDYESGVMFSEAYRPDFIKAESLLEYRSGDGDQITGLASLYGNLIVAKENSLHRITVQMEDATVSRVDELTPDVGCIAPETFMTVDNDLYFVSNQGIMTYNNNAIVPIDEKINEEIRTYLRMLKEYPDPVVGNLAHYITAGYNPEFRELYFNFPQLVYPTVGPTAANQFQNAGNYATNFYQYARQFEAHIYVYNLDKKYWTKFAYSQELIDENWNRGIELDPEEEYNDHYIKKVEHALVNSRLYFTNSIGEMRSADIMTTQYAVGPNMILDGTIITPTTTDWEGHEWAGAYTETPNNPPLPGRTYSGISNITTVDSYLSTDDMPNPILLHSGFQDGVNPAPNPPEEWDTARTFPPRVGVPIKVKYKSHFITLDSETIMKRVNRVVGNVYSEDDFTVRLLVQNKTSSDERISNNYPTHTFTYAPTQVTAESNRHPLTGIIRGSAVIDNNIITAIPTPAVTLDPDNDDYTLDDTNLKGIRFSIELESSMRTQINEFVLFVRPIHVLNNYTRVGN